MIDDLHYFAVEHGEVLFYAIIAGTEFLSQVYQHYFRGFLVLYSF